MQSTFKMRSKEIKLIRRLIGLFIVALFLSGFTAIPIDNELSTLLSMLPSDGHIAEWLKKVLAAYRHTGSEYSFLLYGYDWLAFAHFVLAILFIGPYRDPVKNIWVIEFGLIACMLIFPFAFIAGHFRGIPLGWQMIDCSFGGFGFIPLWISYRKSKKLQLNTNL